MKELRLDENPIIFPKLTAQICFTGVRVPINGRKRADFKLSEYLFEAAIGQSVPDIAVFNLKSGEWETYFIEEKVLIHPKIGNSYYYYDVDTITAEHNVSMFTNFLILHSSATFNCTK